MTTTSTTRTTDSKPNSTKELVVRYASGGRRRAIWDDRQAGLFRAAGIVPRRASQVFVIDSGPRRGHFAVDMSLLGPEFAFCLSETFLRYDHAVAAEQQWLRDNWVLAPLPANTEGAT